MTKRREAFQHLIWIDGVPKQYSHYVWHENTGYWPVSGEIIHHIDGDHQNEDFSNLALMTKSEHAHLHNTERWNSKEGVGKGCIVDKRVGKWGPYRYLVTKHKGKQTWKYLGRTDTCMAANKEVE